MDRRRLVLDPSAMLRRDDYVAWLSQRAAIRSSEEGGRFIRAGPGLLRGGAQPISILPKERARSGNAGTGFRLDPKAKRSSALMSKQNVKGPVIALSRESASCSAWEVTL